MRADIDFFVALNGISRQLAAPLPGDDAKDQWLKVWREGLLIPRTHDSSTI
jgi:hypothetical protein